MTSALDVAQLALEAAGSGAGDGVEAVVLAERSGLARFAGSEVHQPTLIEDVVVTVRVVRDGQVGLATTNRTDREGLANAAARAREAAASAHADSDFPGLAQPAGAPSDVAGFDPDLAELGADDQARLARAAIDARGDFDVYGYFTSGVSELAVVSTEGVAAHQRMTDAVTLVLAAVDGASGYAQHTSWAADGIDPAEVAREATEKAARTRDAKELEPGAYRAVLEPYAFAELLDYFADDSFGALGLLEGRSYLDGRIGERVFDEQVSISDDPFDERALPKAFDFEGVPKQRVTLVERGVAQGVVWDRRTAARAGDGRATTGHAPPPTSRSGPQTWSLSVEPGDAESLDDLVSLVDDGIYVTRLHYLGVVDPREGVVTGMTRDGTFRIRNGRVAEPLANLRFTVSVPRFLADVPGLTREVTLVNASEFYEERYPRGTLVPAIASAHFNITGVGSGPGL